MPGIAYMSIQNCTKFESMNLRGCEELKMILENAFYNCTKAKVKLPLSISVIWSNAFEESASKYCKKVLVPNEAIKQKMINSGYPANRI